MVRKYKYIAATAAIKGVYFRRMMRISQGDTDMMRIDDIPRYPRDLAKMSKRYMRSGISDKLLHGLYIYPHDYITDKTARMGLAARLKMAPDELKEPLFESDMEAAVYGLEAEKIDGHILGYTLDNFTVMYMTYKHDELDDIYYIHYIIEAKKEW